MLCTGNIDAISRIPESRDKVRSLPERFGRENCCFVGKWHQPHVGALKPQAKEAIDRDGGRSNFGKKPHQVGKTPVAHVEVDAIGKASSGLMVEASQTPLIRHLDKASSSSGENSFYFSYSFPSVVSVEMLDDAVGKNCIETRVAEREESSIAANEWNIETELAANSTSCHYGTKRRIYTDGLIAQSCSGDAPATPVASNVEQQASFPWREPQFWYRILRQFAAQMLVGDAIGADDDVRHNWINRYGASVKAWYHAHLLGSKTDCRAVPGSIGSDQRCIGDGFEGLILLRNQEDRHAIYDSVDVLRVASSGRCAYYERQPVAGADEVFYQPRMHGVLRLEMKAASPGG